MTTEKKQSDIAEVRDQLSLDFADGSYLNVISQNLGMDRPVLGYTDDSWRALVKLLALEYKQISNKFRDVLAVIFGPQITEVGSLAQATAVGDADCVLNDTSSLPQLGTLVFDEGLASEETKTYCYIDRVTNTVFLEGSFGAVHLPRDSDSEEAAVALSPLDELVFLKTNNFPTTDYPYPIVLGRGTDLEEVVLVSNNDITHATLTLSTTPVNSHTFLTSGNLLDQLAQGYFFTSSFLLLEASTQFPSEGTLKLSATDTFTTTAAGAGLSDRTVTMAASTLTAESLIGYEIVFDGNVTAALAGEVRKVVDNTDAVVTVDVDFTSPGVIPQIGDTFKVFPIVKYTSIDYDSNTVTLRKPIVEALTIPLNSKVELMVEGATAALSPVKFAGSGWDIIQSNPRVVELLIPTDIRDPNDLRSASYMHDDNLPVLSTTTSAGVSPGDTVAELTSIATFPDAGVLEFDPGGGSAERIPYGKPISPVDVASLEGATELFLKNTSNFVSSGTIVINPGSSFEETATITANDTATNKLTVSAPLTYSHYPGEVVKHNNHALLFDAAVNTQGIGVTTEFYQPLYVTVPIGDFNQTVDTYPGPYVYSPGSPSATATVGSSYASAPVPGTALLAIGQSNGRTAFEVVDATSMLSLSTPFDMSVGLGTAKQEDVEVTGISLKSRARTTMSANSLIGDTTVEVASLTPGTAITGGAFLNANGYRVVLDEGVAADREVVYVIGTLSGPDRLVLEEPMTKAHTSGDTVSLMSDTLSVTVITKSHDGVVPTTVRSTAQAGVDAYYQDKDPTDSELVNPYIESITLLGVTGLDIDGGRVIANFGSGQIDVESTITAPLTAGVSTTVPLVSSDAFPSPTSTFTAILGVGTPQEERVIISANNTGTDVFTLDGGYTVQYSHAIGDLVRWEPGAPETIEYDEIDTNDLVFNTPIVLQYTHYPAETVIDSSADSDPRTNGYDFPLRMPVDILVRLQYLLDIVRAAGIQVELITQR